MKRIRSRELKVRVFHLPTDEQWAAFTHFQHFQQDGYTWRIIRRDYKKRSMLAYRAKRIPK